MHELKYLLIISISFHIFVEVYCMIDVFWFISVWKGRIKRKERRRLGF